VPPDQRQRVPADTSPSPTRLSRRIPEDSETSPQEEWGGRRSLAALGVQGTLSGKAVETFLRDLPLGQFRESYKPPKREEAERLAQYLSDGTGVRRLQRFETVCAAMNLHPLWGVRHLLILGDQKSTIWAKIDEFAVGCPEFYQSQLAIKRLDELWIEFKEYIAPSLVGGQLWSKALEVVRNGARGSGERVADFARRIRKAYEDWPGVPFEVAWYVENIREPSIQRELLKTSPQNLDEATMRTIELAAVHFAPRSLTGPPRGAKTQKRPGKPRPPSNSARGMDPAEKQRRKKQNLCYICGGGGHLARDCRSRSAAVRRVEVDQNQDDCDWEPSELEDPVKGEDMVSLHFLRVMGAKVAPGREIFAELKVSKEGDGPGWVRTQEMLVDTGATHSFVRNANMGRKVSLMSPVMVTLADGTSRRIHEGVEWQVQWGGATSPWTFILYPDLHHSVKDGIVGMDWLATHKPQIRWDSATIEEPVDEEFDIRAASVSKLYAVVCKMELGEPNDIKDETNPKAGGKHEQRLHRLFPKLFGPFDTLPPSRPFFDFPIELKPGAEPPNCASYRYPQEHLVKIREHFKDLADRGLIRPSMKGYSHAIIVVPKRSGELRFCVDYRATNKLTIKDHYPLKLIDNLIDEVAGSKWYTTLDLKEAYHQVRVAKGCEKYTGVYIPGMGLYEYQVIPFGLSNAPAHFQKVVDHILMKDFNQCLCVYLDDVVIHTDGSEEDHIRTVEKVLRRLQDNHLHLKLSKCFFAQRSIEWLGYDISEEGKRATDAKRRKIIDFERPTEVQELRTLLGIASYLQHSIKGYQGVVAPLYDMIRFTPEETKQLETLRKKKQKRVTAALRKEGKKVPEKISVTVKHPKSFRARKLVWTRDTDKAFVNLKRCFQNVPTLFPIKRLRKGETLLLHTDASKVAAGGYLTNAKGDIIEFYSHKFTTAERNWPIRDRELYAIVLAAEQWRHLFLSFKVKVFTDHKSLETMLSQLRVRGDKFARWALILGEYDLEIEYIPGEENHLADMLSRCCVLVSSPPADVEWQFSEYQKDPFWRKILADKTTSGRFERQGNMLVKDGTRICVPESARGAILKLCHDEPSSGHFGLKKTREKCRRFYSWPGMDEAVAEYVRSCHKCALVKAAKKMPYESMPLPVAAYPWQKIAMDFIVSLPESGGYNAALIVVDRWSKFTIIIPCNISCTSTQVVQMLLDNVYRWFGMPQEIVCDQDTRFNADPFIKACAKWRIKIRWASKGRPQTDGLTERVNRTVKERWKIMLNADGDDWLDSVAYTQFAVNSAVAEGTGLSPFEALFGRMPRQIGFPTVREPPKSQKEVFKSIIDARDRVQTTAQRRFERSLDAARQAGDKVLKEGDQVYVKTTVFKDHQFHYADRPFRHPWAGPFTVKRALNNNLYELDLAGIKIPRRMKTRFNIENLKKATGVRMNQKGPLVHDYDDGVYEVDEIKRKRMLNGKEEFLVSWVGYGSGHDSWLTREGFLSQTAKDLLHKFDRDWKEPAKRVAQPRKRAKEGLRVGKGLARGERGQGNRKVQGRPVPLPKPRLQDRRTVPDEQKRDSSGSKEIHPRRAEAIQKGLARKTRSVTRSTGNEGGTNQVQGQVCRLGTPKRKQQNTTSWDNRRRHRLSARKEVARSGARVWRHQGSARTTTVTSHRRSGQGCGPR